MKKYGYFLIAGLLIVSSLNIVKAQDLPLPSPVDNESALSDNTIDELVFENGEFADPTCAPSLAPGRGQGIIKKLKLTEEQLKKFDDLRAQHQKDAVDLKAKIQKNRIELGRMLKQNNIDEKKIFDLTEENSKLQAEMKRTGLKHWFDVYKILDKEQQEIWAKTLAHLGNPQMIRERIKDRVKNYIMERRRGENSRAHRRW